MRILNLSGPFICDTCGSKVPSRRNFFSHNFKCRRATMFCDSCPLTFNDKHALSTHIKRNHLKQLSFKCKECNYKGFCKQSLKSHMLKHSLKTECKVCHKIVANIDQHLKSHVKVKCLICSNFYSKLAIYRHVAAKHKKSK